MINSLWLLLRLPFLTLIRSPSGPTVAGCPIFPADNITYGTPPSTLCRLTPTHPLTFLPRAVRSDSIRILALASGMAVRLASH